MGKDIVQTWDRTWSSKGIVPFDLTTRVIFKNIARDVSFGGKSVLELGCGSGRLSYLAYRAGAEGITLVDFSQEALQIARSLFQGIKNVTFIESDLLNLKLPEEYDIVFSSGVVEHFSDEELPLAVKAHAKHSKEYIAIVVPSDTLFNNRRSLSAENIKLYGYQKPISPQQMNKLFTEANVKAMEIRRFHFIYGIPLLGTYGVLIDKLGRMLALTLRPLDPVMGGLLLGVGKV